MGSHIRELFERILSIFRKRELDNDFNEELASHIEMATKDNIKSGMSSQEARRQALIRFGGIDAARELHRDTRSLPFIENIALDARYAFRMFRKNPGFSLAVIITLALCIGANTAIFTMLDTLIIKPLPFHEPDRIVKIYNPGSGYQKSSPSSIAQYLDFKKNVDGFSHLAMWGIREFNLSIKEEAIRSCGIIVTAEIFDVLALKPVLGRFFSKESSYITGRRDIVLTHSFWKSRYQEDHSVIGSTVELNNEEYEVIGVVPEIFEHFNAKLRFIIPMKWTPQQENNRGLIIGSILGRLKPDAKTGAMIEKMTALEQQVFNNNFPSGNYKVPSVVMEPLQASMIEPELRMKLYLLQGSVLFVLFIGCINVINLFLSKSYSRFGELSVRMALGAGRKVIARQLLMESFLLTCLGAVLGIILALGIIDIINVFAAQLLPKSVPFVLNSRMIAFTILIAILTSLAIGLFQIFHVFSSNILKTAQNQNQRISNSHSLRKIRSGLVVAQLAITFVLLTGGGLLIHSFAKILAINPGFNSQQLTAAQISLTDNYQKNNRTEKFWQRLKESLHEIPGFQSISLATAAPYHGYHAIFSMQEFGKDESIIVLCSSTDTSYLKTVQIPLLEGRWFNMGDTTDSRRVCVVNQDFARQYFPEGSALGKHVTFFDEKPVIIGVVGSTRNIQEEEGFGRKGLPVAYGSLKQNSAPEIRMSVLIRSPRPDSEVISLLREKVKDIDPAIPVYQAGSMENIIRDTHKERQTIMLLLCSFAGLALVLSAVGIYSVMAYDVSKRTHEIGIRGAIGATEKQIITMVLQQGLWKAGIGLLIGLAGAFYLSKFMTSLLFDVKPIDPFTFIIVPILLLLVAVLASYIPAWQASKVDPASALRAE